MRKDNSSRNLTKIKQIITKKVTKLAVISFSVAFLSLLGAASIKMVWGWTEPTCDPTNVNGPGDCNVPAPVTTGSDNEAKEGFLRLGVGSGFDPTEISNPLEVDDGTGILKSYITSFGDVYANDFCFIGGDCAGGIWGGGGGGLWTENGTGTAIYPTDITDKVGIGIQDPDYPLQVRGGNIAFSDDATTRGRVGSYATETFFASDTTGIPLTFHTNPGTGIKERMRIDGDGNIYWGSNTSYPLYFDLGKGTHLGGTTTKGVLNVAATGSQSYPNEIYGVYGESSGDSAAGVYGYNNSGAGTGVVGLSDTNIGVSGQGPFYGVFGKSLSATGYGVYGVSEQESGYAVYGENTQWDDADEDEEYAGYFKGDVEVSGDLTVEGTALIDSFIIKGAVNEPLLFHVYESEDAGGNPIKINDGSEWIIDGGAGEFEFEDKKVYSLAWSYSANGNVWYSNIASLGYSNYMVDAYYDCTPANNNDKLVFKNTLGISVYLRASVVFSEPDGFTCP